MNKAVVLLLLSLVLVFFQNCKQDEPATKTIQDNIIYCFDYPTPPGGQQYNLFYDGTQYQYPQVNLQGNKIIFYRFNGENHQNMIFEVVEYNLLNDTERVLAKGYNIYLLLSSNNFGDVFFNSAPDGLNIIVDGSIGKLPFSGLYHFPVWIPNRRYGFQKESKFYISDINHNLIDSIDLPNNIVITKADVNENNIMVFESSTDRSLFVFTLDLNTKALTTVQKYNSDNKKSISWHPNGESIYYTNTVGLIKYDLEKKQEETILKNCDNRVFENFSFLSSNTLYTQCKNLLWKDSLNIGIKEAIYKMDADGKNIERVF